MHVRYKPNMNYKESVWTASSGYIDIEFKSRPRYCGARVLDIAELEVVDIYKPNPNFEEYIGPIMEFIPEAITDVNDIDWDLFVEWVRQNVPDVVRQQFVPVQEFPAPTVAQDEPSVSSPPTPTRKKPGPKPGTKRK